MAMCLCNFLLEKLTLTYYRPISQLYSNNARVTTLLELAGHYKCILPTYKYFYIITWDKFSISSFWGNGFIQNLIKICKFKQVMHLVD